jgi:hypothetical protein
MDKIARLILLLTIIAIIAIVVFAFWPAAQENKKKASAGANALLLMQKAGISKTYSKKYYRASKLGVDWRLLAAIGYAETDHGRSPLPGVRSGINSAGCCAGVMQICIKPDCGNVWLDYALDGNNNKKKSPYEASDSIMTAANYLLWMKGFLGNNPKKLAAAYNAGPTLVASEGIPDYPETRKYLKKIKKIYNLLQKNPLKRIS